MTSSNIVAQVQEAIRTESLLEFVRENLEGGNLSIRGVAGLVGVHRTSLATGGGLVSAQLAKKLSAHGFEGGGLCRDGFPPVAVWLTVEYFAYESKAEAPTAKAIARVFGAYGVKSAFDLAQPAPSQVHSERAAIDWAAFAEIRRQIDSTSDNVLKQVLQKTVADMFGQDYFAISSHAVTLQQLAPRQRKQHAKPEYSLDTVRDFFEHGAYVVVTEDPKDLATSASLYKAYQGYLSDYPPIDADSVAKNINAFSKRVAAHLGRSAIQKKVKGKNMRAFTGLLVR
jgi:hypothetical protein